MKAKQKTTTAPKTRDEALGQPSYEELQARVKALEQQVPEITFKVGDKGGVSVYGLGRFPVTLYYEQWQTLLELNTIQKLQTFMNVNMGKLKLRGAK